MSGYKWLIDIRNNGMLYGLSRDQLYTTHRIIISPYFSINDSEDKYYFSSYLLDDLEDSQKVFHKANNLLGLYNGVLYLLNRTHSRLLLGSDPKRNRDYQPNDEDSIKYCREHYNKISLVETIWNFLEKDADIYKIVRLLGKQHKDTEFDELYKVYEILHNKWKTRDLNKAKKIHKDYEKFRRTANHPESLGDDARHGHSNNKPLSKPMDIIEARKKVKFDCQELLEHLLNIRIDKENLPEYIKHKFDEIDWSKIDLTEWA
ncbi:hypothetical protein [Cyanothece sp. BG0011]|uniref:hypothetical protein n=1 Tax=Cyanothece sp. BG0011 TaxID=2082950 RepID=UPI000D1D7068|nr:hypothetical protein [Cyanothece sp. BG0011]